MTGRLKCSRAQLRQVLAGGDAGLGRQVLHEHRHQVRGDDDPQQHVAVLGAARDVGREVARVDVGDGRDEGRAEQADDAAHPAAGRASAPAASGLRLRRRARRVPGGLGHGRRIHVRTRIEVASWPPSAYVSPADLDEQRAAERLLVDHPQVRARARSRARRGSAASPARRPRCARRRPRRPARAATRHSLRSSAITRSADGIGSPCGSCVGWPSLAAISASSSSERTCSSTSASWCTRSHGTPSDSRQVELQQPVVAHHLEREPRARVRQPHAAVALVRDEAELVELAHHARRRGRGDVQAMGDRGHADRLVALLQRVDGLRVVLYGGRELCFTGGHRSDYGMPNFGFKSARLESATAHRATLAPAAISNS